MLTRTTIVCFILIAGFTAFVQAAHAEFEDVPRDHWAYEAVSYLEQSGFVIGFPDGTFQGSRTLTRYEFAIVASRLYDQFMEKLADEGNQPSVDQQAVLNMLIEEFQPDIDRLRDLIDINTARIGVVESTVDQLSTRVGDLDTEVSNIKPSTFSSSGDLRVRFEGIYPGSGLQTQRPRYRLRWGFAQAVNDELKFTARLASGDLGAITSTNETIDDAFGIDGIYIDRAYMQYQPASAPGFTMWAGKFQPPWKNTPLVWDSDTNVEGIAQQYTSGDFQLTLGELVPTTEGFYIVAQAGTGNLGVEGLSAFVTYHWMNEEAWGVISDRMRKDKSDPSYLKSNWVWDRLDNPSDYRAIEGYLRYSTDISSVPVTITANYLQNLADAATPAEGVSALSAWNQAASVELAVNNSPSDIGQWQLKGEWGRAQANSVLTWLADSDRGGSDYDWWVASLTYRLLKNTDFAVTYINRDRISKDSSDQIIQVDVSTKF